MDDITGHLSSHRGRISGMDQIGDMQVVKAKCPAAEVQNYSAEPSWFTYEERQFMEVRRIGPCNGCMGRRHLAE
jgi:elongation factor G